MRYRLDITLIDSEDFDINPRYPQLLADFGICDLLGLKNWKY